jgi:glutamate-1-semialdehyde 2,1-aminomutase
VEHICFANSGTEAVVMAIKTARAYTGRPRIVKIEGAYHSSYDFAEVSLDSSPTNWGDLPVSTAYPKGTPKGVLENVHVMPLNNVELLQAIFAERGEKHSRCPDRSDAELCGPHPGAERLSRSHGGNRPRGRCARDLRRGDILPPRPFGAQGLWGITPDLTALGKIIGGGFPVAAVGGRAEVMAVFDPTRGKPALPHGGTFTANPITIGQVLPRCGR